MYVCLCRAVTDTEIKQAIHAGCHNVKAIGEACNAGTDCGSCQPEIGELLESTSSRSPHLRVLGASHQHHDS